MPFPSSGELSASGSSTASSKPAPMMHHPANNSTKADSPVTPSGSHVHKMGGGYHPTERLGVDEFLDLLGQRTGQRGKIGLGQEGLQLAQGIHSIRGARRDAQRLRP